MQLQEPKARESLLTPSMRHSASRSSLATTETDTTTLSSSTSPSSLNVSEKPMPLLPSELSPLPHISAATAALMERTPFAIDDAKDDDDDDDSLGEPDVGDDDEVMDEVRYAVFCS